MKVVCFDFDNVIADGNVLEKLSTGSRLRDAELYLELILDSTEPKKFFRVVKKIVSLGKGIVFNDIERWFLRIKPMKGAKPALKALRSSGKKTVIVSTNDEKLIRSFLRRHGIEKYIDHVYAARFGVSNDRLDGTIKGNVIKTEKVGVLGRIEKLYRTKRSDIVYIGDGLTDLPIIKKVGKGILFCPNAVTRAEVYNSKALKAKEENGSLLLVEKKDLREVLRFI